MLDARDRQAVADMVAAGETILHYTRGGKARFVADQMVQDAVVRRFEVMGEAAARVPDATRREHREVPWRSIAAFRNVLVHADERLLAETVWDVVAGPLKEALPALRTLMDDA